MSGKYSSECDESENALGLRVLERYDKRESGRLREREAESGGWLKWEREIHLRSNLLILHEDRTEGERNKRKWTS